MPELVDEYLTKELSKEELLAEMEAKASSSVDFHHTMTELWAELISSFSDEQREQFVSNAYELKERAEARQSQRERGPDRDRPRSHHR